ncbi:MAG: lactate dehydrogenase [Spirochaetae bacterium HGW-Spirochaetae-5]|nr:MAG: lactate dehydrogenase [Spirochaetae bacterium HGW-Spirochaetae-5]
MESNITWLDFDFVRDFMKDVFVKIGVPEHDAEICAEVLIESDKRGIDSHGLNRMKPIYYDRIKEGIQQAVTNFEIVKDNFATAVVDGHDGMGHVIGKRAMEMAIEKAEKFGLGMVAVRNSTHYGIAGYYATMACEKNMIGITGTNARPSIAPTFGIENMLGTNPLVFGIPTDEEFPFVLDCATSVSQRGKIEVYARTGKSMPEGWVIDRKGESTTDSIQALGDLIKGTAALTPLGGIGEDGAGFKGYGYATVVEILSAALQGGKFLKMLTGIENGKKVPYGLGHFFIAINIAHFTEVDDFKKTAGEILRQLRSSEKMPGAERIYTAGEKEYIARQEREGKGVPVGVELQQEMIQMRDATGLSQYKFPFEK